MRVFGGWTTGSMPILGARMASAAFLVGGLLGYVADTVTGISPDARADSFIAILAAAGGALGLAMPWGRWSVRVQLVVPVFALILVAVAAAVGSEADIDRYLAALPLVFVFIGLTQRPGTAIAFAPVAMAVLYFSRIGPTPLAYFLVYIPVSALVAEAIAQAQAQRDRAHAQVSGLLDAVRVLARVSDERAGAQLVAPLIARIVGADSVAVFVSDRPRSGRLLNRAWFGHPALADAAPLVIDVDGDPSISSRSTQFFRDARAVTVLRNGAAGRIRSAALIPLTNGTTPSGPVLVGVVLAMWGGPRRSLSVNERQSAEVVGEEAGRMFTRLQATAALAHDAHTDPLTELANRRTFTHALSRLAPGDAVVIVDLDHFKRVNDNFGHDTGDHVLRELAACLRRSAREVDCVSRYGGEEFALVLPEAGGPGALRLLERVRKSWADLDPATTFSAGVAVHEGDESASTTLRRADSALYHAKASGRDRDMLALDDEIVLG